MPATINPSWYSHERICTGRTAERNGLPQGQPGTGDAAHAPRRPPRRGRAGRLLVPPADGGERGERRRVHGALKPRQGRPCHHPSRFRRFTRSGETREDVSRGDAETRNEGSRMSEGGGIRARLAEAAEGLVFSSESDRPFEPFELPGGGAGWPYGVEE